MNWIVFAIGSAFFAGITSILAKIGVRNVNSDVMTGLRTIVILIFSWLMVWLVGSFKGIDHISSKSLLFLCLSGIATGGSWLCYFKALQIGDINKVVPIDKSSLVLTMLLSFIFLGEPAKLNMWIGMITIGAGTYLLIQKKEGAEQKKTGRWLLYAVLSAVFASLTTILAKIGVENVESNLATGIRTIVVLFMAWGIVFMQGKQKEIFQIDKRSFLYIGLSGLATGLSWLCYYRALQMGPASIVAPIDKLSILVSVFLAYIIFKEKLTPRSLAGLFLIVIGTLALLIRF